MIAALFIALVALTVISIIFAYGTLVWGLVYMKVWNWFAVGVLALPAITYVQAIAAATIIAIVFTRHIPIPDVKYEEPEDWKKQGPNIFKFVLVPWVALVFAWIIKLFIA
jgi:hypothetical protein